MLLWIATDAKELGRSRELGPQQNPFVVEGLVNDTTYYVRLQGHTADGEGALSQAVAVTPTADPDAPSGRILIAGGALTTASTQVRLDIAASDEVWPLPPSAHAGRNNQVTGNVQMRISNQYDLAGAAYEPWAQSKPWVLDCEFGETCTVYAQFKDGAGNESQLVSDGILLQEQPQPTGAKLMLPILRNR